MGAKIKDANGKSYLVEFFRGGAYFNLRHQKGKDDRQFTKMSKSHLQSTRVMPANYRSGVKGQTFGTCNRMFFWRTRQFGRYDGTAQSYGLATLVDYKGNVMLFQMRTFQIWVPKG